MASGEEYEIPESGAVFTFGRSRFAENLSSHFFVRNDPVMEISCGDEHTALVCKTGRVFLFGRNDYGQLGFGHTKVVNKPSCLKHMKPFQSIHVACGKSHTIISTACNRLFSFGSNADGQLGVGDLNDRTIPELVPTGLSNEDSIVMVSAGCHHSAFLSGKGDLYLWGSNADGQCGINGSNQFLTPQKIQFDQPISSVSCGYYHTAFISNGFVYTFGEEDNGKLGRPVTSKNNVPEKVQLEENCSLVQCGGNHTVILTLSGKAYAFGNNFSGQLGVSKSEPEFSVPQPVQFPNENIKLIHISCGESHSAFITDKGELYTCGDARHGKLCNENESTKLISPALVESFKNYFCTFASCGGCHTMVLAKVQQSENVKAKTLTLPPLKIKKEAAEIENIKSIEEHQSPVELESNNEQEECDTKSNTESNMNEEVVSRPDDIYTEIKEFKTETAQNNASPPEESDETESEMVIVPKEGKIKRLFKVLKRKQSNDQHSSGGKREEEQENVNVEVKIHQTSKACNIL